MEKCVVIVAYLLHYESLKSLIFFMPKAVNNVNGNPLEYTGALESSNQPAIILDT